MLLEVLQFLIDPLFLHLKAIIILELYESSMSLDLLNEGFKLGVDLFDILNPSNLHAVE